MGGSTIGLFAFMLPGPVTSTVASFNREDSKLIPPQTKKRFQFTLRRLLVATAFVAVLLALVTKRVLDYRHSVAVAEAVQKLGGSVSWNREVLETIFRYQTVTVITDVHFSTPEFNLDQCKAISQIPNRFGLQLDIQSVSQETLLEIANCKQLAYLVFQDAIVTEAHIAEFQRKRPDVTVMFGYPGDQGFKEFPAARGVN